MSDYTDIQPELDDFENAVYGEEVRDSMISAIKKIHDIADRAAGAPDASTATAGQAPVADGAGGWAWGDVESGDSVPTEVRQAILALFQNAAYISDDMADEVAVVQSWATEVTSITLNRTSLSFGSVQAVILQATTVPSGVSVVWSSSDTSVATVNGGVVTPVGNGNCTITASAGSKTATCSVSVSAFANLVSISAVYTQSGTVYDTDSLDSLKSDLVVTASYDNGTTQTVTYYTLSGTLTEGTSVITASYGGFSDTFNVTVSHLDTSMIYRLAEPKVFNGTSDYVNTGVSPFATDSDFTIVTTFKANVTQNAYCSVWASGDGTNMLMLRPTNTTTGIWRTYGGGKSGSYVNDNFTITNDNDIVRYVFRHITGNSYEVWASVNGTTQASGVQVGTATMTTSGVELRLGRSYANNTYFTGTVSDFMVYSRAWSDEEIATYIAG